MASRNYVVQRGAVKLDRPVNFRMSSFNSRLPPSQSPGSALHQSSPMLFGSAASKDDGVPGRVRVAVRLRPRNAQEMMADADFADSVELQPESVLDGYNGMVMAYGQTGTGKTFTLGQVEEGDTSDRGIMVRSMEGILADISPETDSISVLYLQLYMETLQDLLDPANDNIPIVEDPRIGDVSVPGATIVEIKSQQSFLELLRCGEAHRVAANTKLNTE